jgi:hypothetical protein
MEQGARPCSIFREGERQMEMLALMLVIVGVVCGIFCAIIANAKNRGAGN